MIKKKGLTTPLALGVSTVLLQGQALAYESMHEFSINDVVGSFDGQTFGTGGTRQDTSIICGLEGAGTCKDIIPYQDKSGVMMYPVDSEFGFYVVDFLGAEQKARDFDYAEGFVGEEPGGGIRVSNAPTLKYKVKPPLGTWCQGLGGTSVKCETEHYTVMEHVLSCYETIPYTIDDPLSGPPAIQKVISTPSGSLSFDCADAPLDDNALILENGVAGDRLVNPTPCEAENDPVGCQMFPNDKTDMLNNIALSSDYSVQLKDDGKPLYGWGGLHKRPNDVRMYARLALPEEWKAAGADLAVTRAHLVIDHLITNNPNDQVRPEDLENEAATGRKPSYFVEGEAGTDTEVWKSTLDCYEGDGDFIEGESPATAIGEETVLRNMPYALARDATPGAEPADPPYAFSSDLYRGLTNAYYTTINRDPFEWSYVNSEEKADGNFEFIGTPLPKSGEEMAAEGLELVSGPRWRLKPNKFGQDLPGLEIPLIECSPPPFQKDNIKYPVGERVTTVINLLDWDEAANGPSPLSSSKGWVDVEANEFVTVAGSLDGTPYTTNGLPMTDDFDIAFYVKGDSKSTALYSVRLELDYEGEEVGPEPTDIDVALTSLTVPARSTINSAETVSVVITNNGPGDDAAGTVDVVGTSNRGDTVTFSDTFTGLAGSASTSFTWDWQTPALPSTFNWTATVRAPGDTDPSNDAALGLTRVRR